MARTVEAVVEADGRVWLLGGVDVPGEAARLAEPALAADWDRPEEDAAWAHLQLEADR